MPPPEPAGPLTILGIDPGLQVTGYGLIQEVDGQPRVGGGPGAAPYGAITPPRRAPRPQRLWALYQALRSLVEAWAPGEMALEDFVAGPGRAAVALGEARAMAMLAAAEKGLPVYLYRPAEVKQFVAGHGRGGKGQIQAMVRTLLGMEVGVGPGAYPYLSPDAADALAVALCHYFRRRARQLTEAVL